MFPLRLLSFGTVGCEALLEVKAVRCSVHGKSSDAHLKWSVAEQSRHWQQEPINISWLQPHKKFPHLPGRLPLSNLGLRSRHITQPETKCRLKRRVAPAAVSGLPKAVQGSHLLCHTHVRRPLRVLGCLLLAGSQLLLLCQQRSELLHLLLLGCTVGDDCGGPIQPLRCPLCHLIRCPQAAYLRRQLGSFGLPLS